MQDNVTPEPPPEIVPMKVNAFQQIRGANSQLCPLFPYMHPGAIVPCTAAFEGGPGKPMGYFVHVNSVDEIALVLGSNGRARTGDVRCGPRKHGVGFDAPVPFFMTMVITQRQLEQGEQTESFILQCAQCNEELVHVEFSGAEAGDSPVAPLPTTVGSLRAVQLLENQPERRTCPKCGHVNESFPVSVWGWERYMKNTRIAEQGYAALEQAGKELTK